MTPFHSHAAILSTGDEVVLGQILDRNSQWLASQLVDLGVMPTQLAAVPDDLDALTAAIRRLAEAAPLVVMTGGLGPTEGDLTRPALARVLGCEQVVDQTALADLRAMLERRGRVMSERQARQAQRPDLARCLPNALGTAPGLHARVPVAADHGYCDVFCLPGPPGELRPMWAGQVVPALRLRPGHIVRTRLLQIVGVPEADAVTRLGDLTKRDRAAAGDRPLVGITASGGVLTLRMRYEGGADPARAEALLDSDEAAVRAALGDHVVARSPATLVSAVLDELAARNRTLAVAESCTGGGLGGLITEVPGASAAFAGGWITYSNALKSSLLGVDPALIERHGAVSGEVASAMASGALQRAPADHALAISGVAGPAGGSSDKPVGTIWIAHAAKGAPADARRFVIPGDREDIRARAARTALAMLWFHLKTGGPGPALLWQAR